MDLLGLDPSDIAGALEVTIRIDGLGIAETCWR
jgi:hypothetical protein